MAVLDKFSHGVGEIKYVYVHKVAEGEIQHRQKLEKSLAALAALAGKLGFYDVKVITSPNILFFFLKMKPSVRPIDIINSIQKEIQPYARWHSEYVFGTVDQVKEELF